MTGAWLLAMAAREPDQAGRLRQFREDHPAVRIGPGEARTMRALIPGENGDRLSGREVVGYTLRELLDKLDQVFGTAPEPPDSG